MNKLNKKEDILYLRKRIIFEEINFHYAIGVILWWPFLMGGLIFFDTIFEFNILGTRQIDGGWIIGKSIAVLYVCLAVIDNIKHNRLIKNGKVIIADIEECSRKFNPLLILFKQNKIKCSFFDYDKEQFWEYNGKYTELSLERSGARIPALRDEWQIPVLVDEKNYKKYYVLTKELAYSYRSSAWEKPIYLTRVIREVDLTKINNGTKFSSNVKFQ